MTAIEFYDRTPIENIISTLTTCPDKIIFIGDGDCIGDFMHRYEAFLNGRKFKTQIEYKPITRNNIKDIVQALSEIIETEQDCVFDLTGGDDLTLVAMGIVYQKHPEKNIQMQRFNVKGSGIIDCDTDGQVMYSGKPTLTIQENIALHGGSVRFSEIEGDKYTYRWELSDDFAADIETMWEICRDVRPTNWNKKTKMLRYIEEYLQNKESLDINISVSEFKFFLEQQNIKYNSVKEFLKTLDRKKLIKLYKNTTEEIRFTYKNKQVKKGLTKEGNILELRVFLATSRVTDKEGTKIYDDTLCGVFIDWDGVHHTSEENASDTENEIDVVAMRGVVPYFISCKNGFVDDEELYKFSSVVSRFGGLYAKKILIATDIDKGTNSLEAFKQRAKDMNINLILDVHEIPSQTKFDKMIRHLINSKWQDESI